MVYKDISLTFVVNLEVVPSEQLFQTKAPAWRPASSVTAARDFSLDSPVAGSQSSCV